MARGHAVAHEPRRSAQGAHRLGITVGARVARCDEQCRCKRRVDAQHRLGRELTRARDDVAEDAKCIADRAASILEPAADDVLQRMEAKLEARDDAEVAPTAP